MAVRKTRWSKVYESSEEELIQLLQSRGITTTHWSATEFEVLPERQLATDITIWLAEGSAAFIVDGKNYSMQPGDTIHLLGNTTLQITAGMSGCVCYESLAED
jgi:hypothetical protein